MTKSPFAELLEKKAESYEIEAQQNKIIIADWTSAIRRLFDEIRGWLRDSDPKSIVKLEDKTEEIIEPNVGRYSAPRLDIKAFGKWVGIIPKALKTIKAARPPRSSVPVRATGRLDITDEITRYVLYRFTNSGEDTWHIEGPDQDLQPLDRGRFEEALMSYFQ